MTKKEFNLAVCKEIKQELKSRKIPYKAVAPEIGISLSNFENKINLCGALFSFYEIAKLARFLEMDIEFFLPVEY